MKNIFLCLLLLCLFQSSAEAASRLNVGPQQLVFFAWEAGDNPSAQTLHIQNTGDGTLNYTLSETINWLSMSATSGSITSQTNKIIVSIDIAGLDAGQSPYTGIVTVTNNDDVNDTKIIHTRLIISAEGGFATLYGYDSEGNIQRKVTPKGETIDYYYDSLKRLIGIIYPDESFVIYTYDKNGNRETMTDWTGTTYYVYDQFNRTAQIWYPAYGETGNISPIEYEYDNNNRIIKMTYPHQKTVECKYDADGRLIEANSEEIGITAYTYDSGTGLLKTTTLPNGVTTTYNYDTDDRLIEVIHKKSNGALLSAFYYTLDKNGFRTSMRKETAEGSQTTHYTYDKLYRLTQTDYPDGTFSRYTYDELGNRLTEQTQDETIIYTYDKDNRLLKVNDELFFYDANGNTIKRVTADETVTYEYDYEDRLIRYQDSEDVVEYIYNGDGVRIAKSVDGLRTNFITDTNRPVSQVLIEASANWSVEKSYIYGLERIGVKEY